MSQEDKYQKRKKLRYLVPAKESTVPGPFHLKKSLRGRSGPRQFCTDKCAANAIQDEVLGVCPDFLRNVFEFNRLDPVTNLTRSPIRVAWRSLRSSTDYPGDGRNLSRPKTSRCPVDGIHFGGFMEYDQVSEVRP